MTIATPPTRAVPRRLRDVTVRTKLVGLAAVAVAALGLFAALAISTLSAVRIGSARYQVIADNNALLADVLPPPEYLVEANLVAHQMVLALDSGDTDSVETLATSTEALRTQFDERLAVWKANRTIDEATRVLITETSATPALRFLDLLAQELVPAVRQGDATTARRVLDGPMAEAYAAHRAAVDEIVQVTAASAATLEADSRATARDRQTMLVVVLVATLAALVALCVAIARAVTRPLGALRHRLHDIATGGGDLTTRLADDRGDELGEVARSFNQFVGHLAGTVTEVREQADTLLQEAGTLANVSGEVSAISNATESETGELADAASAVASAMAVVATSSDEMQTAIAEIARSASGAVGVANSAVAAADRADTIMGRLGESSSAITSVVQVITGLAEQTNLLALNATIEAARAGELGKGFAVVANEVKELARATAEATGSITGQVTTMQEAAEQAVAALADIRAIIAEISEAQHVIAAAVEEQTATTHEIRSSVGSAATSADAISMGITAAAQRTQRLSSTSVTCRSSAAMVSGTAEYLRDLVGQFRT